MGKRRIDTTEASSFSLVALLLVIMLLSAALYPHEARGEAPSSKRLTVLHAATVEGKAVDIEFLPGSPPSIFTFWSIYCKSCVEELEKVQALVEKYGFQVVRVFAVNMDFNISAKRITSFLQNVESRIGKLRFTVLLDRDSKIFSSLGLKHLPTLVYVDGEGEVREVIEGFERGRQRAVISALTKLIEEVAPEKLKEVSDEKYYEVETRAPVCGIYLDGNWVRPVDDSREAREKSVARAYAAADYISERGAMKGALKDVGIDIATSIKDPSCIKNYGIEPGLYMGERDGLDLFMEEFSTREFLRLEEDTKVERARFVRTFRVYRANLNRLRDRVIEKGYSTKRITYVLKFVNPELFTHTEYIEKLNAQIPMVSSVSTVMKDGQVIEDELICYVPDGDRLISLLAGVNMERKRVSASLIGGNIIEIEFLR